MYTDAGMKDLFNKLLAGSNASLSLAGSFDPKVAAAERLTAMQDLEAPGRAKAQEALLRSMYSKGLLGQTGYGQAGAPAGQATNPYTAGLSAAQATQDSRLAADSLKQGENYLDQLLKRSTGLLSAASTADARMNPASDTAAINAAKAGALKAKGAGTSGLLSGAPGMFGSLWKGVGGVEGLKKLLGEGGATGYTPTGSSNFNPNFGEQSGTYTPEYPTFSPSYGDEWSSGYNDYGILDE
jgi:hypothetical protein